MDLRLRPLNDLPVRQPAKYVLYWTQMNRRAESNQALAYAADQANALRLPLLVYEGLTCTYVEANDRMHTFILQGVPEQQKRLEALGAGYCFYLRKRRQDDNNVLYQLAADAALVVTDDYPVFITAVHNARVPARIGVAFHAVDASCIVPMSAFTKREWAARTMRPKLQRVLREHLRPVAPIELRHQWRLARPGWHTAVTNGNVAALAAACEIDHAVKPNGLYVEREMKWLTVRVHRIPSTSNAAHVEVYDSINFPNSAHQHLPRQTLIIGAICFPATSDHLWFEFVDRQSKRLGHVSAA